MKCKYCGKSHYINLKKDIGYSNDFCSKYCEDVYDSATAIDIIKGDIMAAMRKMSRGEIEREILFLDGLINCLELDLRDRKVKGICQEQEKNKGLSD